MSGTSVITSWVGDLINNGTGLGIVFDSGGTIASWVHTIATKHFPGETLNLPIIIEA